MEFGENSFLSVHHPYDLFPRPMDALFGQSVQDEVDDTASYNGQQEVRFDGIVLLVVNWSPVQVVFATLVDGLWVIRWYVSHPWRADATGMEVRIT